MAGLADDDGAPVRCTVRLQQGQAPHHMLDASMMKDHSLRNQLKLHGSTY